MCIRVSSREGITRSPHKYNIGESREDITPRDAAMNLLDDARIILANLVSSRGISFRSELRERITVIHIYIACVHNVEYSKEMDIRIDSGMKRVRVHITLYTVRLMKMQVTDN